MSGSDEFAKLKGYDYRANSNLVLSSTRRRGARDEPTGEAESLRGRLEGTRMGDRRTALKPENVEKKRPKRKRSGAAQGAKKARKDLLRGGNVLDAAQDLDSGAYRPRTRETHAAYEMLLAFVQSHLGDQPADVLRGGADEVLAVLKEDGKREPDKQRDIEELVGSLRKSEMTDLVNIGKRITDYHDGGAGGGNELDDDLGVAVVFDEEGESDADGSEHQYEVQESEDEDDGIDADMSAQLGVDGAVGGDAMDDGTAGGGGGGGAAAADAGSLDPRSVDGYWLQREVKRFFADDQEAQSKATEVIHILEETADVHECENRLVVLLDFDKFDLIKLILHNRNTILYCTRLGQAQSDKERQAIEETMRRDVELARLLDTIKGTSATGKATKKKADLDAAVLREAKELRAQLQREKREGASAVAQRRTLDLGDLAFTQGGHVMSNKSCQLPQGSYRTQKKGYEEVFVPARKKKPFADTERLIPIRELPEWAQPAFAGMEKLNRIQSRVYEQAFKHNENMLVCAPTGAGKTNVAMLTVLHELGKHRMSNGDFDLDAFKVVYIAPMKALVQEMVMSFGKRLAPFGIAVGELTGDKQMTKAQIAATQVIVTTPEKWDIITRKSGDRTYTQLVRLVIIDEIHLLHDDRGPVLESIIARTIRQVEMTQEMTRIVGLSATLPNYRDVALLLRIDEAKGLFFFDNSFRPCPLQQQFIGVTERKAIKRFQLMNEICYEKVMDHAGKQHQVLIFVHTRKETAKTARALRDMAQERDELKKLIKEESASKEILLTEADEVGNADLRDLLPYGFACHHAGMSRDDRTLVEDLFADKHIQVLVSTATLAWGVNLPAHTVIIKGTQVYNPEKGAWVELSFMDIMQMLGRAGRPQYDRFGEGILITQHSELQYYLSLMNEQLPVESQFIAKLADNLNAEVVLGTVANTADAVEWLGYTYLYVRMLKNPTLYGVSHDEMERDPFLDGRRADLVHTAASLLDKTNLCKYDRRTGQLQVTDLGRVAAHYYVTHHSMAVFNEHLKVSMTDIELFRLFSLSGEFKNMIVRQEEKVEMLKLMEKVPIPIKESLDEPSSKVNVLLQAYISRLRLDGFALVSDMVYVTQSAGRIMRALFEIVLRRGWSALAVRTLDLCKMIQHRMWGSQSPLRQFAGLPELAVKKLEKKEISWERFYDYTPQELGELIRLPKYGKLIYRFVHSLPRIELAATVQPITRSTLRVDLVLTPDFKFDRTVHHASEPFWIIVEDVDGEYVLHHEHFLLKAAFAEDEHYVTFTIPMVEPVPPQYFVRVVSDRWLSSEVVLPISFRHLLLPDKFAPHTELLDLQPLPVTALRNPRLERLHAGRFSHYNPIQTQVFTALYTTDDNVLVAAPTGAGKTVCAEFAMLRAFAKAADDGADGADGADAPPHHVRIVYVAPMEELVHERFADWADRFDELNEAVVVELTGETAVDLKLLERGNIILATPERWDVMSRRWRQRKNVQNIDLFIIDELHLIGGRAGPTVEVIVSRMRYMATQLERKIRMVALSASVANAKDLGVWVGAGSQSLFAFHPNVRPVPLEIHIQGFDVAHYASRLLAMARPTYAAIARHAGDKPVLVFVPSRKQARLAAIDLLTFASADNQPTRFLHADDETMAPFIKGVRNKALRHTLACGVGFLHDALSEQERASVERLFAAGAIQVLVATSDKAWGMTLQAHTVVVMGAQRYNGHEHRYTDYPLTDIMQMMGRAGRPLVDEAAKCFLFCQSTRKEFFKKFLYEPLPVESHLQHFIADHFNAEIVTKTIENKQDAVDYLTWTFMYRRLTRNPNYYNLTGTSPRHLSDHMSELVEETINDLEASKCIVVEDDMDVAPLNLGMIAAYYNIRYTTIELFASSLKEKTKLRGLLEILSYASEFADTPVRHKEDLVIRKLAAHMPLKIDRPSYTEAPTKVNVLLQCHFSRRKLPVDLAHDQAAILRKAHRLLQAMVDVIASNGWLRPALAAMELSQMITQAMWIDRDSQLLQLPHVGKSLADAAKAQGIESVFDLMDMEDDERTALLAMEPARLADVARVCNQYPNVDVAYQIAHADEMAAGETQMMQVLLERDEDQEPMPVYAPYFPTPKQEGWWVVLGEEPNTLLSLKRVTLARKAKARLAFTAPAAGAHELKLYVMSDAAIGCDQELTDDLSVRVSGAGGADDEGGDADAMAE